MNQPENFLETLRHKIFDAKDIARGMLLQDVDADIAIEYTRGILKAWDDLDKIETLSHQVETALKRIESDLSIDGYFNLSKNDEENDEIADNTSIARRPIIITITDGMLRQHLLTLTKAIKTKRMSIGQRITLLLPNEEKFSSVILAQGNRLQERSLVRKFYIENKIKSGDLLQLHDVETDTWRITIDRKNIDPNTLLNL